MSKMYFLLIGPLLFDAAALTADGPRLPNRDEVLNGLRTSHPRLLASEEDFTRLHSLCRTNQQARQWLDELRRDAENLIETPPLVYRIPDGKRLLSVSRAAKDRILRLALAYRLTEDQRFADRAWRELDTVLHFKDWNPSHFLDTAEMTFAVAIGYDWLYDTFNDQQREQLRRGIRELGLEQGLPIYRNNRGWSRSIHNWNQVCNGGMGVGALAIADDEPELAAEVLHAALHSLPLAMHEFRPDGGWGEGPGYWRYATEYNVYLLAALRTALGTDFALSEMPGFPVTGDFPIHFTGPVGLTFNYADAHDAWHGAPQLFWMASAFDEPAYAAAQMNFAQSDLSALDLLWGAAWLTSTATTPTLPRDRWFSGVSVVTLRSAWNDPRAVFAAFKGGDNRVNHGQLDLGTFVLDANGVRWAVDLGPDDYNIPGYFGNQRWSYYRNRTEGHNTLTIGGANQTTTATAEVIRFASDDRDARAVVDLTRAYPEVTRAWRGLALVDRRHVIVHDEIEADHPIDVAWHMHTEADVSVDGRRATLTRGDEQLHLHIVEPAEATFHTAAATTEPPQRPLKNVQRLTVTMSDPVQNLSLVVLLSPDKPGPGKNVELSRPLNTWPND